MQQLLGIFALACGLAFSAGASAITIDGQLGDWGLHQTGKAGDWTPIAGVHYEVEDYIKGYDGGFVNPGWGGQAYDAEALYLKIGNGTLYVAMVTGHNPATVQNPAANSFARGDFALNFTGATNDGTYEFGISTMTRNGLVQGGVYAVSAWNHGLAQVSPNTVTSIQSGNLLGMASLVISDAFTGMGAGPKSDTHWAYELAVPLSLFNGFLNEKLWVQWTMNCANDILLVDPDLTAVDAPPVLALFALGVPALLRCRRR